MINTDTVEIPLSKRKLFFSLLGCILFVIAGIWILVDKPPVNNMFLSNPYILKIVGIIAILFFGGIGVMIIRKLSDTIVGLTIDGDGIIDNSSGISFGRIPWDDIISINEQRVANQKFLMIIVKNPEDYINRKTNLLHKKAAEINFKNYGSPIGISANTLQINFISLQSLLNEKLRKTKGL